MADRPGAAGADGPLGFSGIRRADQTKSSLTCAFSSCLVRLKEPAER